MRLVKVGRSKVCPPSTLLGRRLCIAACLAGNCIPGWRANHEIEAELHEKSKKARPVLGLSRLPLLLGQSLIDNEIEALLPRGYSILPYITYLTVRLGKDRVLGEKMARVGAEDCDARPRKRLRLQYTVEPRSVSSSSFINDSVAKTAWEASHQQPGLNLEKPSDFNLQTWNDNIHQPLAVETRATQSATLNQSSNRTPPEPVHTTNPLLLNPNAGKSQSSSSDGSSIEIPTKQVCFGMVRLSSQ